MPTDPKYLVPPESIEDTSEFMADTFFPKGEIDSVNFQVVIQWIMGRELEDEEVAFALEKFYHRIIMNGQAG